MIAKVEFLAGDLFPGAGLIVTNLAVVGTVLLFLHKPVFPGCTTRCFASNSRFIRIAK